MTRKIWSLCLVLLLVSISFAACRASEATPTFEEPVEELSLLFVHNATSGTLNPIAGAEDTFHLTMEGVSYSTLWFSERPDFIAGHIPTRLFIENWGTGENSFATSPPNAALDILEGETDGDVLVVQLSQPKYDQAADRLTYQVQVLQDAVSGLESFNLRIDAPTAVPRNFSHASLFIDCRNLAVYNDRLYIGTAQRFFGPSDESIPEGWYLGPIEPSLKPP
ncbi:hypothetical protein ACFLTJ_02410 [Chloroflexota bacterium]